MDSTQSHDWGCLAIQAAAAAAGYAMAVSCQPENMASGFQLLLYYVLLNVWRGGWQGIRNTTMQAVCKSSILRIGSSPGFSKPTNAVLEWLLQHQAECVVLLSVCLAGSTQVSTTSRRERVTQLGLEVRSDAQHGFCKEEEMNDQGHQLSLSLHATHSLKCALHVKV